MENYLQGYSSDSSILGRLEHVVTTQFGAPTGFRDVTPDSGRKFFDQLQFMQEHFTTQTNPGPIGHGFTQQNLDTGQTYWAADVGPNLRLFGLDTCNQVMGADGAVPQDQFDWLQAGLAEAKDQNKMAIVLSHHNSKTLENTAVAAVGDSQPLIHTEQFIDMLLQYPNLIAWSNGHTHINTIVAHPRDDGSGSQREACLRAWAALARAGGGRGGVRPGNGARPVHVRRADARVRRDPICHRERWCGAE